MRPSTANWIFFWFLVPSQLRTINFSDANNSRTNKFSDNPTVTLNHAEPFRFEADALHSHFARTRYGSIKRDLEIILDRGHGISLCFYYLFQPGEDGGRKKTPAAPFDESYQKLESAARKRNKARERSAIKATLKGWAASSPNKYIPQTSYTNDV